MRYLKYVVVKCKLSVIREMHFRVNFLINLGVALLESLLFVCFYSVLLGRQIQFGDWGEGEIYLFMGTFLIVHNLFKSLLAGGVDSLPELVRTGELDGLLLRPLEARWILAFSKVRIAALPSVFVGIWLVSRSPYGWQLLTEPGQLFTYLTLVMAGVYFLYLIQFALYCSAFWIVKMGELIAIFNSLLEFAEKPFLIYPQWLHLLFSSGITFFLVGNYQVMALRQGLELVTVVQIGGSLILWHGIGTWIWRKGVRRYHGASR